MRLTVTASTVSQLAIDGAFAGDGESGAAEIYDGIVPDK
jgi:hypothetical protein